MADATPPEFVRFFVATLVAEEAMLTPVRECLQAEWGAISVESGALPFRHTDYYAEEMGDDIRRAFFGFATPLHPADLAERKVRTNALEAELASALASTASRPVNLDPGYLAPDKLVLASAKNFSHRIYLRDGIYAEVTLQWRGMQFESFPWTFPDYASGDYDPFFLELREQVMANRSRAHAG